MSGPANQRPGEGATPGGVLSAWRRRAVSLDPTEKAIHQAILRAFATSGRPPTPHDLEPVAAGRGRGTADVLRALHDIDAICLGPDGQVEVAYPFSSTPTRHRVLISQAEAEDLGVRLFGSLLTNQWRTRCATTWP